MTTRIIWTSISEQVFEARLSIHDDDPDLDARVWRAELLSPAADPEDRVRYVETERDISGWDLIGRVAQCYE
jgi:hypothetical protein